MSISLISCSTFVPAVVSKYSQRWRTCGTIQSIPTSISPRMKHTKEAFCGTCLGRFTIRTKEDGVKEIERKGSLEDPARPDPGDWE